MSVLVVSSGELRIKRAFLACWAFLDSFVNLATILKFCTHRSIRLRRAEHELREFAHPACPCVIACVCVGGSSQEKAVSTKRVFRLLRANDNKFDREQRHFLTFLQNLTPCSVLCGNSWCLQKCKVSETEKCGDTICTTYPKLCVSCKVSNVVGRGSYPRNLALNWVSS